MPSKKSSRADRDGLGFVALPFVVLDCPGFLGLSGPAVRLLIDMARQYSGRNNGRLVACAKAMKPRGWNSNDTLSRARKELEEAGFLVQTRLGMRPNRAAWFALSWQALDWSPEMDIKRESFRRGLYLTCSTKTQPLHRQTVQTASP